MIVRNRIYQYLIQMIEIISAVSITSIILFSILKIFSMDRWFAWWSSRSTMTTFVAVYFIFIRRLISNHRPNWSNHCEWFRTFILNWIYNMAFYFGRFFLMIQIKWWQRWWWWWWWWWRLIWWWLRLIPEIILFPFIKMIISVYELTIGFVHNVWIRYNLQAKPFLLIANNRSWTTNSNPSDRFHRSQFVMFH